MRVTISSRFEIDQYKAESRFAKAQASVERSRWICSSYSMLSDALNQGPKITVRGLDSSNIRDFRTLNQIIFPVKYSDRFYTECLSTAGAAKLAYSGQKLVGAVASRLEPQADGLFRLYIMTLGVYAAYREQRIGSFLLELALDDVKGRSDVTEAYLHVQVSNTDAIDFYLRRGFHVAETLQNYYRRIQPPHAVLLRKPFLLQTS